VETARDEIEDGRSDVSSAEKAPGRTVSRFEANLLYILRFFLRGRGVRSASALELVKGECPRPPCLSRACVELVQDDLARGCVALLTRLGGWRRERFLRDGQVAEGRLWQRTPPPDLGLTFSRHSLEFLVWITAENPRDKEATPWNPPEDELSVGDRFLLYLAYRRLRDERGASLLPPRRPFVTHSLCRLAYQGDFTRALVRFQTGTFAPWTTGVGACILEVLGEELAGRFLTIEREKADVRDWKYMQTLGHSQDDALTGFIQAVEGASRLDLARFLLPVFAQLLPERVTAERWLGGVHGDSGPRLADRLATYRAAFTLLRQMERLRQWERQARNVGYFDEGYAASQLWKAAWEQWDGETLHRRAQEVLRAMEPLQPKGTQP
jgi:hypothetical protein